MAISLCRADLTSEKGLEQLDSSLQEQGPNLSGLVYCAATGIHRPIDELTDRHFDLTFNLNVRAFFKLIKGSKAASAKRIQRRGHQFLGRNPRAPILFVGGRV